MEWFGERHMRRWIDENGNHLCEPDCVEEWLWMIWAVGYDYDGCDTVDSLKGLVDELVEMSSKARECLFSGRLFKEE